MTNNGLTKSTQRKEKEMSKPLLCSTPGSPSQEYVRTLRAFPQPTLAPNATQHLAGKYAK